MAALKHHNHTRLSIYVASGNIKTYDAKKKETKCEQQVDARFRNLGDPCLGLTIWVYAPAHGG